MDKLIKTLRDLGFSVQQEHDYIIVAQPRRHLAISELRLWLPDNVECKSWYGKVKVWNGC